MQGRWCPEQPQNPESVKRVLDIGQVVPLRRLKAASWPFQLLLDKEPQDRRIDQSADLNILSRQQPVRKIQPFQVRVTPNQQ